MGRKKASETTKPKKRYSHTTPLAQLHGLSPKVEALQKNIFPKIPGYVLNVMKYLPHDMQDTLLIKYEAYAFLAPERNFNKGYKSFFESETDLTQVAEVRIFQMLDGLFSFVSDEHEKHAWVYQNEMDKVAGIFQSVVKDKSPQATHFDRLDFFNVCLAMTTGITLKYFTACKLAKSSSHDEISAHTTEAALQACQQVESLIKKGIFYRIALTQKHMLDSKETEFRTETRKVINSIKAQDNMMLMEEQISYYCKALETKLKERAKNNFFLTNTTALLEATVSEQLRAKPPKKPRKAYTRRKPKE